MQISVVEQNKIISKHKPKQNPKKIEKHNNAHSYNLSRLSAIKYRTTVTKTNEKHNEMNDMIMKMTTTTHTAKPL